MTLNPKHGQFAVDAGLQEHLAKNGATLSELISAINDQKAMTALSKLLSGDLCCSKCQARDVGLVLNALSGAFEVPAATRPDFDAAVRWQGARMADVHSILAR
ncbi:hypothetical protein [Litoreibacter arenae]|uniref:Uncharacterized protein n=1 Tax=Litoreibacter arenae DSM 19593 TaxID=1123360 RepID=S9QMH3_9RHOB|nr:hypothetical protein [Litoreibacter arenae]EPX80947.1 hypothetical protein thalar_00392 [Litoreibacter arenae DSM 19593]